MRPVKQIVDRFRRFRCKTGFTTIGLPDGTKIAVDESMRAYLQSDAPEPTQVALDSILKDLCMVRVWASGCDRDTLLGRHLLLTTSEPDAISALRAALTTQDGPGGHCMCHGGPTLELLAAGGTRLALLGVHHGRSIRWARWKDDALLTDGRALLQWLDARGVREPLQQYNEAEAREHERERAWNRWMDAMPAYLKALPEELWKRVTATTELSAIATAAANACPDTTERVVSLFRWYGHGAGPWTGYPEWEELAEKLLLTFPVDALLQGVESASLDEAGVEGAARFFAGSAFMRSQQELESDVPLSIWYGEFNIFQPKRSGPPAPIPASLRRRLREHCLTSADPDKRQRAGSAFAE